MQNRRIKDSMFLLREGQMLLEKVFELFYDSESGTFREHDRSLPEDKPVAYFWPVSALYTATIRLKACEIAGGVNLRQRIGQIESCLGQYEDSSRMPPAYQALPQPFGGSNRFYDDNEWIGLDLIDMYHMTGESSYLARALRTAAFLLSGLSSELGGGIYWCEQTKDMKNTCSNGPGSLFFLNLYRVTGNEKFFHAGRELYDWTKKHLQDHDDQLYFDHIKTNGMIDPTKYTYNAGTMMHSATVLYQITADARYLSEASAIASSSERYFRMAGQDDGGYYPESMPWFISVLFRGYESLYEINGDARFVDGLIGDLLHVRHHAAAPSGLFEPDWSGNRKTESKWLLDQAGMIEMYARASMIADKQAKAGKNI